MKRTTKQQRIEPGERYEVTPHGITWGDATIEFVMSDPKIGRCLEIRTPTQRLQVRVTPGGRLRLGFEKFPWDGVLFRADVSPERLLED